MRSVIVTQALAVLAVGCGRLRFDPAADAATGDTAADGAGRDVFAELGNEYTYVDQDFEDTPGLYLNNNPSTLCALRAPFTGVFAILAGREIIEVGASGTVTNRSFAPSMSETTGPDEFADCLFGTTPELGSVLFLGVASNGGGDGLFYADATWTPTRYINTNNAEGLVIDDGTVTGGAAVLFESNLNVLSTPSGTSFGTYETRVAQTVRRANGELIAVTRMVPSLVVVSPTFAVTEVVPPITNMALIRELRPASPALVYALFDQRALVRVFEDGTYETVAEPPAPELRWVWAVASLPNDVLPEGLYILEETAEHTQVRIVRIPLPE